MTSLPHSNNLPVHHLAAAFNHVTNSYKFYWFLAILDRVKENAGPLIPLQALLANMVAGVWYPTNYFYLSLGKQDRLSGIAVQVRTVTGLTTAAKKNQVLETTLACLPSQPKINEEISSLGRFVPQRFLRPFFATQLKGKPDWQINSLIVKLADTTFADPMEPCLYRFVERPNPAIEIQPDWFDYLQRHLHILYGFCLWHLVSYLQKNNPNVPNLAGKLFEPEQRDLKQARAFWKLVFGQTGSLPCIYSGQPMDKNDFSLDHFLPWRFVAHDLLWNIIPAPKVINSAKSDNLPRLDLYFDAFAALQYQAVQSVIQTKQTRLLEDYVLLFRKENLAEIEKLPAAAFATALHDTIAPQIQIAKNMGFPADWSYFVS